MLSFSQIDIHIVFKHEMFLTIAAFFQDVIHSCLKHEMCLLQFQPFPKITFASSSSMRPSSSQGTTSLTSWSLWWSCCTLAMPTCSWGTSRGPAPTSAPYGCSQKAVRARRCSLLVVLQRPPCGGYCFAFLKDVI